MTFLSFAKRRTVFSKPCLGKMQFVLHLITWELRYIIDLKTMSTAFSRMIWCELRGSFNPLSNSIQQEPITSLILNKFYLVRDSLFTKWFYIIIVIFNMIRAKYRCFCISALDFLNLLRLFRKEINNS